jgi:hypothetical protein
MKIIEVILHNDDSEDDEDDLAYQKKHYEVLRAELSLEKNDRELEEEISELKSSSAVSRSRMRRETNDCDTQTDHQVLTLQESEQKYS